MPHSHYSTPNTKIGTDQSPGWVSSRQCLAHDTEQHLPQEQQYCHEVSMDLSRAHKTLTASETAASAQGTAILSYQKQAGSIKQLTKMLPLLQHMLLLEKQSAIRELCSVQLTTSHLCCSTCCCLQSSQRFVSSVWFSLQQCCLCCSTCCCL